jgi:hypothetical protein
MANWRTAVFYTFSKSVPNPRFIKVMQTPQDHPLTNEELSACVPCPISSTTSFRRIDFNLLTGLSTSSNCPTLLQWKPPCLRRNRRMASQRFDLWVKRKSSFRSSVPTHALIISVFPHPARLGRRWEQLHCPHRWAWLRTYE